MTEWQKKKSNASLDQSGNQNENCDMINEKYDSTKSKIKATQTKKDVLNIILIWFKLFS